jgi:hypothetical protein
MAYDAGSDRIVMFGGGSYPAPWAQETWAYDYDEDNWIRMEPTSHPSPRYYHAMAYSAASDRVILFGGYPTNAGPLYNDTWAYDFDANSWEMLSPSAAPGGRSVHGLAYDTSGGCLVLFGGSTFTPPYLDDETWTYPACAGEPSTLPIGAVVMSTDKACYLPGEPVAITATGWAGVPSIGDFPWIFWAIEDASGGPVFETMNMLDAIGSFNGTLTGTWDQAYRLLFGGNLTGQVPNGTYVIRFYELPPLGGSPPDWVDPATIEIGDCGGEVEATIDFDPDTLNPKSKGKWVSPCTSSSRTRTTRGTWTRPQSS